MKDCMGRVKVSKEDSMGCFSEQRSERRGGDWDIGVRNGAISDEISACNFRGTEEVKMVGISKERRKKKKI